MDVAALKLNAVQWFYLLLGLRDGHPGLFQKHRWGPWTGKRARQICAGRAEHIPLAIIVSEAGRETVRLVVERMTTFATRTNADAQPDVERPLYQVMEKEYALSVREKFGLKPGEQYSLFFPAISSQPHLWQRLKKPRSVEQVRRIGTEIYEWVRMTVPGVREMPEFQVALCKHAAELFRVSKLWNYPRTNRPTSDDKRVRFFAEALAGLTMGVAPATATRKLARWNPPLLWPR